MPASPVGRLNTVQHFMSQGSGNAVVLCRRPPLLTPSSGAPSRVATRFNFLSCCKVILFALIGLQEMRRIKIKTRSSMAETGVCLTALHSIFEQVTDLVKQLYICIMRSTVTCWMKSLKEETTR
jgi:hypothetical protein